MRATITIRNPFTETFLTSEDLFFDFPTLPVGLTRTNSDTPVEGLIEPGEFGYVLGVLRVDLEGEFPELVPSIGELTPARHDTWLTDAAGARIDGLSFLFETTEVTIDFGRSKPTLAEVTTTYDWGEFFGLYPIINPGRPGPNEIIGTEGRDVLDGTAQDDSIRLFSGNDRVDGRGGSDVIVGGGGNDRIEGGRGVDSLYGGVGQDRLSGGQLGDLLFGGGGRDTLAGLEGRDDLRGGGGVDTLYGGDGADELRGGTRSDHLFGQGGDDTLIGDRGNDVLIGGAGNDTLMAQHGEDVLTGGAGSDTFIIHPDEGDHTVTDMDVFADRLDLRMMALTTLPEFEYDYRNSLLFANSATAIIPGHGLLTIEFDGRGRIDVFENEVLY